MKRIGLIGAGRWATPYAVSAKQAGAELVGIYTPDPSAAKLAERAGSKPVDDPRKLMDMVDCVLIGSPTDTHIDYLQMAVEAGVAVLCASPVVNGAGHCEKLAALPMPGNFYSSFPLRARPEYQRLKKALASGELGTSGIFRLGICRPPETGWRAESDRSGGLLIETGVHLRDALEWLAGPIDRIYGASNEIGKKQYNLLVARMQDGSIAHLEISWAEAEGVSYDYYEIAGSNGLLDYDSRRDPLLVVDYHDERASEALTPGATAAENELKGLIGKLGGDSGGFTVLAHGLEVVRKAVRLKNAVEADEVLNF